MESLSHLKLLFGFNDWANRCVFEEAQRARSDQITKYLTHILVTEDEYYRRLFGKDSTGFDFWPVLTIDECRVLLDTNVKLYSGLLDGFDEEGLGQKVSYKTSEGVEFESSFREVLTHVLFHSMNHRGQILTLLREQGSEPPSIDYIVFERNRRLNSGQ